MFKFIYFCNYINNYFMKLKITLGFLVFVLSFPAISQTIIWEEDFKTRSGMVYRRKLDHWRDPNYNSTGAPK